MTGLVVGFWSQDGKPSSRHISEDHHNVFMHTDQDSLHRQLITTFSHDGSTVVDATESSKQIYLNPRPQPISSALPIDTCTPSLAGPHTIPARLSKPLPGSWSYLRFYTVYIDGVRWRCALFRITHCRPRPRPFNVRGGVRASACVKWRAYKFVEVQICTHSWDLWRTNLYAQLRPLAFISTVLAYKFVFIV